jgi:hypothetical protein
MLFNVLLMSRRHCVRQGDTTNADAPEDTAALAPQTTASARSRDANGTAEPAERRAGPRPAAPADHQSPSTTP